MENEYSIFSALYRRRMGRQLQPTELAHFQAWCQSDPANQKLLDRLDEPGNQSPALYAHTGDGKAAKIHRAIFLALVALIAGFFGSLVVVLLSVHT